MEVNAESTEAECVGPVTDEQAAKAFAQNTGSGTAEVNLRILIPCGFSSVPVCYPSPYPENASVTVLCICPQPHWLEEWQQFAEKWGELCHAEPYAAGT